MEETPTSLQSDDSPLVLLINTSVVGTGVKRVRGNGVISFVGGRLN